MTLIFFSVVGMVISVIAYIITKCVLMKKNKEGQKIIVPNAYLSGTGFLGGSVFLIISTIAYMQEGTTWAYYFFVGFVWFSLLLVYGWFGMIVIYDNEGFTRGWLPLQKKKYTYEEVTGFDVKLWGYELYVGHKCISFDDRLIQSDNFILNVSSKYRDIHGKKLPTKKKIVKWDIFNGHLENPEEFIIIIIMFLVIGFGMLGWSIYELHDYKTEEELTRIKVVIDDAYTDDNHLILNSKIPGCKFDIKFLDALDKEVGQILDEVSKNKPIYVYAKGYKEKNKTNGTYDIYCVENVRGEEIISLKKMNELNKEVAVAGFPIVIVLSAVSISFSMVILFVGRYPHKFSKRIKKAIFQNGYLH